MIKYNLENVIKIDRKAEEVTIKPTAMRICELACFYGSIKSLDLQYTHVTIIEKNAFSHCLNLKRVEFPACLEEICEGAFKNCLDLKYISFPSDSRLRKIGKAAFRCCMSLREFKIPRQLEFIGELAFNDLRWLKYFDFRGTKVRHIGPEALGGGMTVFLPSTITLESIMNNLNNDFLFDAANPFFQRANGYYFYMGSIFKGDKELKRVFLHEGIERIETQCFDYSMLVSVSIPSSVTKICDDAFHYCKSLKSVRFHKYSHLTEIGYFAFFATALKRIQFPRSLKILREGAFNQCESLENVVFPQDSQLEIIERAFVGTNVKNLSLPSSVKEINKVCNGACESIYVNSDYYKSNDEKTAIFSKDGTELVDVIYTKNFFEIPDGVRVIKRKALSSANIPNRLIIPASVEVIEKEALDTNFLAHIIEFQSGSRLKYLAYDAVYSYYDDIIINNENFIKMENGVVMSLNPKGIVFVPRELTEIETRGVEVIYSHAFLRSSIRILKLPRTLKKIYDAAFYDSSIESIIFEKGTELNYIGKWPFEATKIQILKLPRINGEINHTLLNLDADIIEFPSNLKITSIDYETLNLKNPKKIICPKSSLPVLADLICKKGEIYNEFCIIDDK